MSDIENIARYGKRRISQLLNMFNEPLGNILIGGHKNIARKNLLSLHNRRKHALALACPLFPRLFHRFFNIFRIVLLYFGPLYHAKLGKRFLKSGTGLGHNLSDEKILAEGE